MSFQRITQATTLAAFVLLLFLAAYPFPDGLEVDYFLRLDPLLSLGTMIASRSIIDQLLPGLVILGAVMLLGRFFCGHICPMGTTLDALQILVPHKRATTKNSAYENTKRFRHWKYLGLLGILGAAVGGSSLVFLGSPLSWVTRMYSLVLHPTLIFLGELGLQFTAPLASKAGFHSLLYADITPRFFATNVFVFVFFAALVGLAYAQPRFWCRNLCPAGALMGLFSRRPLIRRHVSDSCTGCGRCVRRCPVSAISESPQEAAHSECIVCMRCKEVCPESAVSFTLGNGSSGGAAQAPDPTRRGILLGLGSGLMTAGLFRTNIDQPNTLRREQTALDPELIRPPGALPEPEFLSKCIRCGECLKACPTNTLQPVWLKAGLEGIFSPVLMTRLAGCATHCNVCGKVCPTGAIRDLPLIEKNHAKIGTAWVVRQNCLAWEQDKKCLVCDEVCPYNALAFRPVPGLRNAVPFVLENRCTGCGWCESKCPVTGASAIRINIVGELRLANGSYVERAGEQGFEFRPKDKSHDRIAPGTFDAPGGRENEVYLDRAEPNETDLPPGFGTK
jgi:MauM/NapG family ferredoxin protein